ncbi:immunity protein YezG family protein [Clostridium sp. 'White wine YQ']|uniref:immunity protein YezG family protein n=1 Tax=Clostridium sp. 'White wine YQ' TaxID=3027474 RepID=UPI002365822F|nr:immunity protein YezG family protein [Clostridium sp. 'White wine YQ']MDD7793339.1 DUF600 family protein [Clostridium sp. 'White wine YQ']
MINENDLNKYYGEIAEKLDEIIPMKWDKIVMYAEELGTVNSASFYFYTDDCNNINYSGDIPSKFGVSRETFKLLLRELREINRNLWQEFKNAGETAWSTFTLTLNSDGKFKVKFDYEINNEIGLLEREIRWAYDELGIVPEDEYEMKLLDEYRNCITK